MLKDPKSRALVDNFAGQWLQTRTLKTFAPDPKLPPGGVIIDTRRGEFDASVDLQLREIERGLTDRLASHR